MTTHDPISTTPPDTPSDLAQPSRNLYLQAGARGYDDNLKDATIAAAVIFVIGFFGALVLFFKDVVPFKWWDEALIIVIGISLTPYCLLAYIHFGNMMRVRSRDKALLAWFENRLNKDINGDGRIGTRPMMPRHWFSDYVSALVNGEKPTLENAIALGLHKGQWRAARDYMLESGMATKTRNRNGSYGFLLRQLPLAELVELIPDAPPIPTDDENKIKFVDGQILAGSAYESITETPPIEY